MNGLAVRYTEGLKSLMVKAANDWFSNAVEIGNYLLKMKKELGHGNYTPALEEAGMSESKAKEYTAIARQSECFVELNRHSSGVLELPQTLKNYSKVANAYKRGGVEEAEAVIAKIVAPKTKKEEAVDTDAIEAEVEEFTEQKTYTEDEVMELIMRVTNGETVEIDGREFKIEIETTDNDEVERLHRKLKRVEDELAATEMELKVEMLEHDREGWAERVRVKAHNQKFKDDPKLIAEAFGAGVEEPQLSKKEIAVLKKIDHKERAEVVGVSPASISNAMNGKGTQNMLRKIRVGLENR